MAKKYASLSTKVQIRLISEATDITGASKREGTAMSSAWTTTFVEPISLCIMPIPIKYQIGQKYEVVMLNDEISMPPLAEADERQRCKSKNKSKPLYKVVTILAMLVVKLCLPDSLSTITAIAVPSTVPIVIPIVSLGSGMYGPSSGLSGVKIVICIALAMLTAKVLKT